MSTEKGERKKIELKYWKDQKPPESGKLFEDPNFPPNANSLLGLDSNGKPIDSKAYNEKARNINTSEVGFARAKDIFGDKYKLFSEKIEMDDVIQGKLGDCYFLSSVANLCKFPSLIMKLFKTKEKNADGFYEILLYIDGRPQIVIVDDYLPVDKRTKRPVYAQSKGNEIWVMLLEKAWAKVNGGYANIISGLPCEALEFLTGLGSLSYDTENMDADDINEYKNEIVKNVQIADQNNCLISCSTSSNPQIEKVGLVEGHAYTLISFTQITTSQGKKVYLFKIRNPWSQGEWNGDWSDKSSLWDSKAKSQVQFQNKEDGVFFMSDTDFFKYFTHVEICYILYDSISVTYTIEGEENLKDASVFNIQTEGEGFLSVSVLRKSWRANRELRDKILPTHISIVKYDPKPKNRLKTFSDYNGTFESFQTCALNVKVVKGNYLISFSKFIFHFLSILLENYDI
jgi:calpain-15